MGDSAGPPMARVLGLGKAEPVMYDVSATGYRRVDAEPGISVSPSPQRTHHHTPIPKTLRAERALPTRLHSTPDGWFLCPPCTPTRLRHYYPHAGAGARGDSDAMPRSAVVYARREG